MQLVGEMTSQDIPTLHGKGNPRIRKKQGLVLFWVQGALFSEISRF